MSDVYYSRPITVTEERLREANEKQAKQRALREALDSQRMEARGAPEPALTKAQQKRAELMRYQSEQRPGGPSGGGGLQPNQYQSTSLPPNFSMSSSLAFGGNGGGGQPQTPYGGGGGGGFLQQAPPVNNSSSFRGGGGGGGGYDSRSLPPDFGHQQMMMQQQQVHPQPVPPPSHGSPKNGPPNYSFGGGGGANFHYHPQQQQGYGQQPPPQGYGQQQQLQAPNFNLAEIYAQQNQGPSMHAPQRELAVPISPRGMPSQHMAAVRSSNNGPLPWEQQRNGNGTPLGGDQGGGGSENIQHLLRMANRVTDQPHMELPNHSRQVPAGGGDRVSRNGGGRRNVDDYNEPPPSTSGPTLVPRAQSKEARGTAGRPPASQQNVKREKVAESRVEKLQKELADKQYEMQRMREKERNWEEQVKQLKDELKNARQKERDLSKVIGGPQRAETAPNTGSIGKLAPLQHQQQQRPGGGPSTAAGLDKPRRLAPNGVGTPLNNNHHPQQGNSKIPPSPARKDNFNNARVFNQDTFRPITAPLEPIIEESARQSTKQLPPLPDSLKLASFNTRRIAFGLQQTGQPVTMTLDVLFDFVDSQVITRQQAEALWSLFLDIHEASGASNSPPIQQGDYDEEYEDEEYQQQQQPRGGGVPDKRPSPPPGSRPNQQTTRRTSDRYPDSNNGSPMLPGAGSSMRQGGGGGKPAQLRSDDLRRRRYDDEDEEEEDYQYDDMRQMQTKRPTDVSSKRQGQQLHSPTYETYADLEDDDEGDYE